MIRQLPEDWRRYLGLSHHQVGSDNRATTENQTRSNFEKTLCALKALEPKELLEILDEILEEESAGSDNGTSNSQPEQDNSSEPT